MNILAYVDLLCTGGGEVGGGVVLNELCVQYQAQFTTMNQRFRYKVQSLFLDLLYTIINNNLAWAKKLGNHV